MSLGKPPKYKPEYIEAMIKIFEAGKCLADFCVYAQIGRSTFYDWLDNYPDFNRAYDHCLELQEAWLTEAGKQGMMMPGFNSTVWSMLMRNKTGLTEHRKIKIDLTKCKTSDAEMRVVKKEIARGNFTAAEAKHLVDIVAGGANIHEKTEVAKDVESLKEMVKK